MSKYIEGKISAYQNMLKLIEELDPNEECLELIIFKKRVELTLQLYDGTLEENPPVRSNYTEYLKSIDPDAVLGSEDDSDDDDDDEDISTIA